MLKAYSYQDLCKIYVPRSDIFVNNSELGKYISYCSVSYDNYYLLFFKIIFLSHKMKYQHKHRKNCVTFLCYVRKKTFESGASF